MQHDLQDKLPKEDYLYLQGRGILDDFAPKDIEEYLHTNGGIIGQDEAVKTAAILVHRHFQQRCPSVSLFCGPSGCGKTEIWKAVQRYLSRRIIVIVDASSLSPEGGWKGGNKISNIFRSLPKNSREDIILILDEFDKCSGEPQYGSNGTNYSEIIQNSLLTLFNHDTLFFCSEDGRDSFTVNCTNVSIVLLGAFQHLLEAKGQDKKALGFGANITQGCNYGDTVITENDLIKYTCLREEIVGRIDRIVTMQPLTCKDYVRILATHIDKVSEKIRTPIDIDTNALVTIARSAIDTKLGARWAKHKVDAIIDELVYNDPYAERFVFRYEPPDADEKRQSVCME